MFENFQEKVQDWLKYFVLELVENIYLFCGQIYVGGDTLNQKDVKTKMLNVELEQS